MLTSRMRSDDLIGTLFAPEREAHAPWLVRLWLCGSFAAGLIGWLYVMGWGVVPLDFHDWTGINVPRLTFLQNALQAGEWPLHMAGRGSLHGVTDRFLALPDVVTSPQTVLLLFMPVTAFIVADVLIQYALGFAGVLLLRRHFDWSVFTTSGVLMLVLFNGHILAHYSVGHFTWAAYFMFPYVALLVFRFLDGDTSARSIAGFAAVMFYMVLSGGQHHLTWVLLLLVLMVPFCWSRAWWIAAVVMASGLLSAVRLLPPALELQSFRNAGLVADVIGFPSTAHLVASLVLLRRETAAFNEALPGNIWFFDSAFYEFNAYIGVAGLAVVVAGLYHWLRGPAPRYAQLIVPLFVMTTLSIGSMYRLVRATAIPLLEGERYTARLFSLPLVFLIVLAAVAIDRRLRTAAVSAWHRALAWMALVLVAVDTMTSMRLWRVAVSSGLFGPTAFNPADAAVVVRADAAYSTAVIAGMTISLITAVTLIVLTLRERQSARPATRDHSS
jgi:hypothetical protein